MKYQKPCVTWASDVTWRGFLSVVARMFEAWVAQPSQTGRRCWLPWRQLQRQQQLLIGLKTQQSFQLFQLVGKFGSQIRVVEPGTDQALVDALDVALVVRL